MRRLTLLIATPFLIDVFVAWALGAGASSPPPAGVTLPSALGAVPGPIARPVAAPSPRFQIVGREVYGGGAP